MSHLFFCSFVPLFLCSQFSILGSYCEENDVNR
jgi:hypothetical protein